MKEHACYVIHPTGTVEKWTIQRNAINVTDSISAQFQKSIPIALFNHFSCRGRPFNVHFETGSANNLFCVATLSSLPLRVTLIPSPIAAADSKIMVPKLDESSLKTIDMVWSPPENCTLVYAVQAMQRPGYYQSSNNYLYAYSATGIYTLPIGNLYDDCKVCTGDYDSRGGTLQETVQKSMDQFVNSKWNTHLVKDLDNCYRTFRWEAKADSFSQMKPDGNWKSLATKVSVPYAKYVTDRINATFIEL